MATLLLRFAAPLQSWGIDSKFDTRKTGREPSKSGVVGLLAAALGYRRDEADKLNTLNALRFGVRTDREGKLLCDFQMVHGEKDYVALDIETTGLSVQEDRIIEVAAIRVKDREVIEEFQTLVDLGIDLGSSITDLTGISQDMLKKEGISIWTALEKLTAFVGSDPIVCHNADFDCSFLMQEAKRNQIKLFRNKSIDTLSLARKRVNGVQKYTLTALCDHFGIDATGAHRALKDCYLVKAVFEKLNEI